MLLWKGPQVNGYKTFHSYGLRRMNPKWDTVDINNVYGVFIPSAWCCALLIWHIARFKYINIKSLRSSGAYMLFSAKPLLDPVLTYCEIWINIQQISFKKIDLKMSSAKWWPFRLGRNVLNDFSAETDVMVMNSVVSILILVARVMGINAFVR